MKGFRFSLWSMFLGVAAVALVCAALVKPTAAWAMAFQATALGVLTFALLAALVYERGAARAFWIGFAVVGWGNLGLQRFQISEVSLTREISEQLMDAIHPYSLEDALEGAPDPPLDPAPAVRGEPVSPAFEPYLNIHEATTSAAVDPAGPVPPQPAAYDVGEARTAFSYLIFWIWPLLLGFGGGIVAQQMYARRERLAGRAWPSGSGSISQDRQIREVQKPGG